jgi:hypothetical protein
LPLAWVNFAVSGSSGARARLVWTRRQNFVAGDRWGLWLNRLHEEACAHKERTDDAYRGCETRGRQTENFLRSASLPGSAGARSARFPAHARTEHVARLGFDPGRIALCVADDTPELVFGEP